MIRTLLIIWLCVLYFVAAVKAAEPTWITLSDDGGWCWFEDERAIVHDGKLIVGSVAAGVHDRSRRGSIEVTSYDFATTAVQRSVLHREFGLDDHNSPVFCTLSDGRILAMYCRHGRDNRIHMRTTANRAEISHWLPERIFIPSLKSSVTYSNLLRLANENETKGRVFNFFRGFDNSFKPSWMTSDDEGKTWTARGLWIDFPTTERHRPYVKFASDQLETIHFVFTEGHPRNFDNSLYHAYYRRGTFYRSDGVRIKSVMEGPIVPAEATKVFAGDQNNVAWPCDIHLDQAGRPVVVYSVQKNSGGLPSGHPRSGRDHRYRYARFDGHNWRDCEIAYAGSRLYPGEDDYTGLICLDPQNTNAVYLSSNVNIFDGSPNTSGHYEIYHGIVDSSSSKWMWSAVTENSTVDNLRPIVPIHSEARSIVLWLRGKYTSYTDYDLDVVGIVTP